MRILQFVYGLDAGGIESFVTQLNRCRQAFPTPFDFVTYTPRETRDFFQPDCEAEGSTVHKLGSDCSRFFPIRCMQKRWRAFQLLQRERYDVVHIHNSHSLCMVEAGLCRLAGVKAVFVHAHNTGISDTSRLAGVKRGLHALLRPLWPLAAAQLLACSREAAVWMYGSRRAQRGGVHVLTNGVRLSAYARDPARRQATRARLGLSNGFVVGHVGRFDAQKNHAFLLRAFAAMARTAPDAQLLLAGDGPLLEETRALSESLGIAEKTVFLGRSREIPALLEAMDAFAMPSLFEGLPMAAIEAQAAGLPLVISDAVSPEIRMAQNVRFVPLDKGPDAFAEALLSFHCIPRTGEGAAALSGSPADIEETARKLAALYQRYDRER